MKASGIQAEIWVVDSKPSATAEMSEIVWKTTPKQFALAAMGGMEMENLATFTGEYAERDAKDYARQELTTIARRFTAIAEEIKADANGGTWCDSTDTNGKPCRMFVPNNDR